tara:strand:+ start:69 stop:863 length:795 start_codon:yes stop_codon:yes gene_type:complete
MKTEVRIITPDVAKEMLKRNPNNRRLSAPHVRFLAKQMNGGEWQFDGQPIRFDVYGRLLDGQHRLSAVVLAGEAFEFLIVSGLKEETFQVMDTGKNRSANDSLSVMGVKYSSDVAATAKLVMNFKRNVHSKGSGAKVTNSDVVEWFNKNEKIIEIMRTADRLKAHSSRLFPRSYIAFLIYILGERNVTESELFVRKLCTGLDLESTSPIFLLRKKLIEDKISKAKLPIKDRIALMIKAWNFYRMDKSPKVLRWNKDLEKFPELI